MALLRLYARVLAELGSSWRMGVLLAFANLALAGAQFGEPVLFGRIIDRLSGTTPAADAPASAPLLPLIAAWAGLGLFSIGSTVLVALNADRLAHRRRLAVMAAYFDHVLHLPLTFHNSAHSGRLLKIMLEGASAMASLWLSFFREHCAAFVALVVLMPLSLAINWRLGILLVAMVVLFGVLTALVLRRTEGMQGTVERYHSALAERASDALGNIPVIQSFSRVEAESRAMRDIGDTLLGAQLPVLSWWALAAVATKASATLTILAIFVLGIRLRFLGLASLGEIVTFTNFATLLISRLEQAVGFVNAIFLQAPKIAEFFGVLDTPSAVTDHPGAIDPGRLAGEVSFENISFSYDGQHDAVSDLTFKVMPGETIALVGATGSGKSTTLGLLHRVFDPTRGRILIDGIDIRDMRLSALRANIGVVFQEPMLFARSVGENLRVGKADANEEEIALALERAQARGFVERQPRGLDTIVGERGRSLSGGERQRLAIARALLKDPPIMILDEATSALDAFTEKLLQAALREATRGRTTFVIAHRLATIRDADRILVFDAGRLVEEGNFENLVAKDGPFAKLARAQFMDGAFAAHAERSDHA